MNHFKYRFSHDFETRSGSDITKEGMHKYVAHKDFKILMMSHALDKIDSPKLEPVELYECYGRPLPKWYVKDILFDPTILKTAYNAPFEINAIEAELGVKVDRRQWQCTRIMAGMAGYPMNLKETAKAMKLDTLKDIRGTQLIKLFTIPATEQHKKRNGGNYWNYPEFFPKEWEEFCQYCIQDTIVERNILLHPTVADMPEMPAAEREYWLLDQRINDRGIMIDVDLVKSVIEMHDAHVEKLVNEGTKLTGLHNVNSPKQLLEWLESNDCMLANLQKDTVMEKLGHPNLSGRVKRVLEIRTETSKSSMSKYNAMVKSVGRDNRIRGMTQHYGANRTGRAAGRILNTLNMVKNKLKKAKLGIARELVRQKLAVTLAFLFGKMSFILSQLTRTMFIARPGCKLVVSDFASIESRTGSYFADAEWKLEAFRQGKDIYLVNASNMYGIPYEELDLPKEQGKHPLREMAKVGELLAIYSGGENGMIAAGALKSGQLKEKDLTVIKKKWREANPETVKLWADIEDAARDCIKDPGLITQIPNGKLRFMMQHGNMLMKLPSGRTLSYVNCRIQDVTKVNKRYNPPALHNWCKEQFGVGLPVWVQDDLKYHQRKRLDYDCREAAKWFKDETGEEIPWFAQVRYCSQERTSSAIVYEGMQDNGTQRVWGLADTHGGKLFENANQGLARDILYHAMLNLDDEGMDTVLHVYDETVNEVPMHVTVAEINRIMEIPVPWAPEIPLKAEGFETMFYMKD